MKYDLTVLTDKRYVAPQNPGWYEQNVLNEDQMVRDALERQGLRTARVSWDDPDFDWSQTRLILFRTTWDYFDRYPEFEAWLQEVSTKTILLNSAETIRWNIDKHYLLDLQKQGVRIPPTRFIEIGDEETLKSHFEDCKWEKAILKPAISGAARHTYLLTANNVDEHEAIHSSLIAQEAMLLQEFQNSIPERGEVSMMVFGTTYSHAVLKKAKAGDFRVQDDFGGTLHPYEPNEAEIAFALKAVKAVGQLPLYARVDVMWNNSGVLCLSELELIEPELWFRRYGPAADLLAAEVVQRYPISNGAGSDEPLRLS